MDQYPDLDSSRWGICGSRMLRIYARISAFTVYDYIRGILEFVAFWCAGIILVSICWALDAVGSLARNPDGSFYYDVAGSLPRRQHVLALLRFIPITAQGRDERIPQSERQRGLKAVAGRTKVLAPWNIAFALAAPTGALGVAPLELPDSTITWYSVGSIIGVTLTLAILTSIIANRAFLATGVGLVLLTALIVSVHDGVRWAMGIVATLSVIVAIYCMFRLFSDSNIKGFTDQLFQSSRAAGKGTIKIILGNRTFERLYPPAA